MGRKTRLFCKMVSEKVKSGEITKQYGKTIIGQAKSGDYEGAAKGLSKVCRYG